MNERISYFDEWATSGGPGCRLAKERAEAYRALQQFVEAGGLKNKTVHRHVSPCTECHVRTGAKYVWYVSEKRLGLLCTMCHVVATKEKLPARKKLCGDS